MRYTPYLWGVVICAVLVVVLLLRVMSLDSRVRSHGEPNGDGLAALQDSLKRVQAELATAKESMPGLGAI